MGAFFTPPAFGGLSPVASAYVAVAVVDLALQLIGWAISVALHTEKIYDFFGTGTFLAVNVLAFAWGGASTPRSTVVFLAVALWALRLGGFLTLRAARLGDSRFEAAKNSPLLYLVYWLMQAVWVFTTLSPVVWCHTASFTTPPRGLWAPDIIGGLLFAYGWVVEAVADAQKFKFKSAPANRGKFIDSGLWAWARYPNYWGEMCVWAGIWLLCSGSFGGVGSPAWATVVSPLFVVGLLFFVSGIPLQEKQAGDRWGGDPAFMAYRARTNLLVPLPFKLCPCWPRSAAAAPRAPPLTEQ